MLPPPSTSLAAILHSTITSNSASETGTAYVCGDAAAADAAALVTAAALAAEKDGSARLNTVLMSCTSAVLAVAWSISVAAAIDVCSSVRMVADRASPWSPKVGDVAKVSSVPMVASWMALLGTSPQCATAATSPLAH
eukprot:CAMPEP_0197597552 /NCGR_PEP_ID=MMETSP1326-20131121/27576_1 /TAXON_ID=1155430 /ORGANISM="Genus nov. species nov., Strain RCC2288" /LENGTH=137 /DNA_ID=CAMNT_0043164243 /DNA_START=61 /DNA_END=471 /DNA_ORIENTATION=-